MPKKNTQRTIRFDEETIRQMDVLCDKTEIELPKLIRSLVGAAYRYFEANGHIYLPIEVRPLSGSTSPGTTEQAAIQATGAKLPHEKKRNPSKKLSKAQLAGREFNSAGRGKQMRDIAELHKRVKAMKPTAEGVQ